jgi:hypothetical protein
MKSSRVCYEQSIVVLLFAQKEHRAGDRETPALPQKSQMQVYTTSPWAHCYASP